MDKLEPGTVIDGKYRIDKAIGAGGMGAVYAATQIPLGRKVAVKRLHPDFAADEEAVKRFQREAKLAASIGHDNICETTDFGISERGAPYLVMPLLQGQSLAGVIKSRGKLSPERLIDIANQTLFALEAAHDAGIVHRDLKPDNIFVTKIGDREDFVKLLDFGICKAVDSDVFTRLTRTGTVLGTPCYMAPEQAKGSKVIDHRVDIYAMGVILYEGLTGSCPFDGDSYNEVMYKIIAGPFKIPSAIDSSVPPAFEQVILTAMARDPLNRFPSAAQMRQALDSTRAQGSASVSFAPNSLSKDNTAVSGNFSFAPTVYNVDPLPSSTHKNKPPDVSIKSSGFHRKAVVFGLIAVAISLLVLVILSWNRPPDYKPAIAVPPTPPIQPAKEPQGLLLEKPAAAPEAASVNAKTDTLPNPRSKFSASDSRNKEKRGQKKNKKATANDSVKGRFGTKFIPAF